MALPGSSLEIARLALDLIGESRSSISSINPPGNEIEELVAANYDVARQSVAYDFCWNCLKKRATITRTDDGEFDYDDKYGLPNDYVRLLSVNGDQETEQLSDYDITGRDLNIDLSGADSCDVRYIADIEDVTVWSAGYRDCVIYQLALNLAYAFSKKKSDVERISSLYEKRLPGALSADGQEVPPKRIQTSKALAARQVGGSRGRDNRYFNWE